MFCVENPRIIDSFEKAPLISRGGKKTELEYIYYQGKIQHTKIYQNNSVFTKYNKNENQ